MMLKLPPPLSLASTAPTGAGFDEELDVHDIAAGDVGDIAGVGGVGTGPREDVGEWLEVEVAHGVMD